MARTKIEKGVVRYENVGGSAGNVESTVNDEDVIVEKKAEYLPESEESEEDDYLDDGETKEPVERK